MKKNVPLLIGVVSLLFSACSVQESSTAAVALSGDFKLFYVNDPQNGQPLSFSSFVISFYENGSAVIKYARGDENPQSIDTRYYLRDSILTFGDLKPLSENKSFKQGTFFYDESLGEIRFEADVVNCHYIARFRAFDKGRESAKREDLSGIDEQFSLFSISRYVADYDCFAFDFAEGWQASINWALEGMEPQTKTLPYSMERIDFRYSRIHFTGEELRFGDIDFSTGEILLDREYDELRYMESNHVATYKEKGPVCATFSSTGIYHPDSDSDRHFQGSYVMTTDCQAASYYDYFNLDFRLDGSAAIVDLQKTAAEPDVFFLPYYLIQWPFGNNNRGLRIFVGSKSFAPLLLLREIFAFNPGDRSFGRDDGDYCAPGGAGCAQIRWELQK